MSAIIGEAAETYGFSANDVKKLCQENLNFLGALVLGVLFRCDFPETHLAFFQLLTSDLNDIKKGEASQIALGLPRGFCKTTLLKIYVLWVILFTDIRYILVVSKSATLAEFFIADVCGFLDNPNIVSIFGNWRGSLSRDTLDIKCFSFNNTPRVLQAIGAETSVRGTNINNERPELIVCEDIQSKECADSIIQNENFITWFVGTLLKVKSAFRNQVVFLGNMYNEQCLLNRLQNSKEWFSFITAAILESKQSLWPEFRSYESLMSEFRNDISMKHPEVFLAEVMNDPLATATSRFDVSKVKEYPYYNETIPDGCFITIDPATGITGGNLTAIILHWIIDGKKITRRVFADLWGSEATVIKALEVALDEGASLIAVENVAYQSELLNKFIKVVNEYNIQGIVLVPVSPKGRSKNSRIKDYLKRITDGTELLHPDAKAEVLFQAARFNHLSKNNEDDILDGAAYGDEVAEEHWHQITYNARTFDALGNKVSVWPTVLSSAF